MIWRRLFTITALLGVITLFLFSPTPLLAELKCSTLSGELRVSVINVGLGDAILIQCPKHHIQALIDGGDLNKTYPNAYSSLLKTLRRSMGTDRVIEYVINTHPHPDHISGLERLVVEGYFSVEKYFDNGGNFQQGESEESIRNYLTNRKTKYIDLSKSNIPELLLCPEDSSGAKPAAKLLFFSPSPLESRKLNCPDSLNTCSVVSRLRYGKNSFLFMADAGKTREMLLLSNSNYTAALKSTVLKVAHHGSFDATGAQFLRTVDPDYVVISTGRPGIGRTNKLKYPSARTVSLINDFLGAKFPALETLPFFLAACREINSECFWRNIALHPNFFATPAHGTVTFFFTPETLCIEHD